MLDHNITLDLYQNEAINRVSELPRVQVPQHTTSYLGLFSAIAIAILVIVLLIFYIKYARLHMVFLTYLRNMSVEWRLAIALAIIWIVGSVIFMVTFSDDVYYRFFDTYWMVAKVAIIPPMFGIFSFWLIKSARRK